MNVLTKSLKASLPSVLVGVGAAIVAPVILPALGAVARPLAKRAIRGCLVVTDYVKELASEASESITAIVEEEKTERAAVTKIVAEAASSQEGAEGAPDGA
jgi:hypothetical protein